MFGKSKVSKSFQSKPRTKEEIDQDYTKEAVWLGHKTRVLEQLHQDAQRLQAEMDEHTKKLITLNAEGMSLQQQEVKLVKKEALKEMSKEVAAPEEK